MRGPVAFGTRLDHNNCIYQGKSCSRKGGFVVYLKEKYDYKIRFSVNTSDTWEGLFIDVMNGGLLKTITIGNIYRPPRNLNINYRNFIDELVPILNALTSNRNELVIVGDFNINFLKITEREIFSDFFDTIGSHSLFPTMSYPTRFQIETAL